MDGEIKITVCTPCTCGRKWYQCTCDSVIVAEYICHGGVDGTHYARPEDVRYVQALHPGMELVYLSLPTGGSK